MAIVLGLNAKLLRGAAGSTGSTEVKNVKDLTLNLESGEADVTTRATGGWRASAATLKEASLEFGILYDTEDADFQAFQAVHHGRRGRRPRRRLVHHGLHRGTAAGRSRQRVHHREADRIHPRSGVDVRGGKF